MATSILQRLVLGTAIAALSLLYSKQNQQWLLLLATISL
jgi:hypothetical protein